MEILNMFHYYLVICAVLLTGYTFEAYKTLTLEDDALCSPIDAKRKIKLESANNSGLIISLKRLRDHPLLWQYSFNCKFYVEAKKSDAGIFSVIQSISFRRNHTSGECVDYVQYKRHDGTLSSPYCGQMSAVLAMDHIFDHLGENTGPTSNSFVDPTGLLAVHVYIAKEPLAVDEERDLNIVFTSYRNCKSAKVLDLPCREDEATCIYERFFNDGYINCPYSDCVDEEGCSDTVRTERKYSIGSKVIIGSVGTLILVFAIFVICVWQCRKYQVLCWSEAFANPQTSQQPSHVELGHHSNPAPSTPSVPGQPTPDEEKDLPPSYESLFPDR